MSTCKHNVTAPEEELRDLHTSQAGMRDGVEVWRHKCCNCAFAAGELAGRDSPMAPGGTATCKVTGQTAPMDVMDSLPIAQAGSGRHRCAICAYHKGFERGTILARGQAVK